jgi:hypothetical protein
MEREKWRDKGRETGRDMGIIDEEIEIQIQK